MLISLTFYSHPMILSADGIEDRPLHSADRSEQEESVRDTVCAAGSDTVPGGPPAHPRISCQTRGHLRNEEQEARIEQSLEDSRPDAAPKTRGSGCCLGDSGQNPTQDLMRNRRAPGY